MNSDQYFYLQNKKYRAITVDWDIISTYGNDSALYCLTDFQAAWLLSMTEYMRWSTRWENCPCTQNDLEAMKAELDYNLMNCLEFQPYQLQYLYDSAQQGLLADYTASWDGSLPSSVNPDAPDDFFNGDGSPEREDALCTAITLWGYSYAVNWSQKASLILGVAYAVGDLINFMVPVGGQIAVQAVADLVAPLQAQVDALNDLVALDTVLCEWKTALEGVAITAANWTNAVQGLVYTAMSNEWYIQQLFASDTQLLGNFLSFVNSLGDAFELANIGVYICACGTETWTHELDFRIDPYNEYVSNNNALWTPTWFDGLGWEGGREAGGATGSILITLPSARTITMAEAVINYNNTATNTRINGITIGDTTGAKAAATVPPWVAENVTIPQGSGLFGYEINDTYPNIITVGAYTGSRQGASSWSYVQRVILHGLGDNPFV